MPGSEVMDDVLESRRASSRGLIPKAKVKTIKMTFVIITGYSSSEALISISINPKYDNIFITNRLSTKVKKCRVISVEISVFGRFFDQKAKCREWNLKWLF